MKEVNNSLSGPGCPFPTYNSSPPVSATFPLWVLLPGTTGSTISISGTQAFCFLSAGCLLRQSFSIPFYFPPPSGMARRCHLVAAPGTAPGAADPEWLNSKHAVQQQSEMLDSPRSPSLETASPTPPHPVGSGHFPICKTVIRIVPTSQSSKIEISPAFRLALCRRQ